MTNNDEIKTQHGGSPTSLDSEMEQYNRERGANFMRAALRDAEDEEKGCKTVRCFYQRPEFYLPTQSPLSSSSANSDDDRKPAARDEQDLASIDLQDTESEPEDEEGAAFAQKVKKRAPKKRKHESDLALQDDQTTVEPQLKRTKEIDTRTAFDRMLMETPVALAARAGLKPSSGEKQKKRRAAKTTSPARAKHSKGRNLPAVKGKKPSPSK